MKAFQKQDRLIAALFSALIIHGKNEPAHTGAVRWNSAPKAKMFQKLKS